MRFPGTEERVPLHTKQRINDLIVEDTLDSVAYYSHAPEEQREERIRTLAREWDTERAIAVTDGSILLAAGILGLLVPRRWMFVVPAVVGAFLLQHALQGWCLLMPILRRTGFRTPYEIAAEKAAIMR